MSRIKSWISKYFGKTGNGMGRGSPHSGQGPTQKDDGKPDTRVPDDGIDIQLSLHDNIIRNDVEGCRRILAQGFDPNQPFCTEYKVSGRQQAGLVVKRVETTYVHLAIIYRRPAILQVLLEAGASPKAKDSAGRCPLQVAVTYWPRVRYTDPYTFINPGEAEDQRYKNYIQNQHRISEIVFQLLIDFGAEIEVICGERGDRLLHIAAKYNAVGCVVQLLSHGARVNMTNKRGETPLNVALCGAHLELARLLVTTETDVNIEDQEGVTALHHASQVDTSPEGNMIKLLLYRSAEIDHMDRDGNTPLHHAAMVGNASAITILLKNDADADRVNHYGCSALSLIPKHAHTCSRLDEAIQSLQQWSLYTKPKDQMMSEPIIQCINERHSILQNTSPPSLGDMATHKARRCLGYSGTAEVMTLLKGWPYGLRQLISLN